MSGLTAALLAVALPAASQTSATTAQSRATAQAQYGRGDRRIDGQRLTTMRALAHRLDDAAEIAARTAGDTAAERNGRFRQQFLWAINDFARQAQSLHERLDRYGASPWDVADEVDALNLRARSVTTQLRTARAFPDTYEDWAQAQKALELMNAVLRGQTVIIPPVERRGYQPFDEGYQYRNGRHWPESSDGSHDGYLAGQDMINFRRLAESLTVAIGRLQTSVRQSANIPERMNRPLSDLRYFAQRAEDLNRTSNADVVNGREVFPIIDRMLQDARQSESDMRSSRDFPNAEWAPVIMVLEQMAAIVRIQ
jgi:hypothetical protein